MCSIVNEPLPRPRTTHLATPKPAPRRFRWSRDMTMAAGFVCPDGIVMCADSQESAGDYKFPVEKLLMRINRQIQTAIAGAGHGPMVDMATDRILRALTESDIANYSTAEAAIANELVSLYDREFRLCPVQDTDESIIELLIGVKLRDAEMPVLYKTHATVISRVADHVVIGSGRAVQYQLYKLYHPPQPTRRVIPIAISLLSVAEVVLRSVGGAKLVILNKGAGQGHGVAWDSDIEAVRVAQRDLELASGEVLLDLLDVTKSDDDFQKTLFDFSSRAIELRVSRMMGHQQLVESMRALMKALEGSSPTPTQSDAQMSEDQQ